MKLTVAILVLVAASGAIEVKSRRPQKSENTDKRELEEGNTGIDKRAPVLPTVSPSVTPGVEYADAKEAQQEKSPAQLLNLVTENAQQLNVDEVMRMQKVRYAHRKL